jgi:L-alanine-DL-glutamate epimerase-like enolase superfamily enzyme
VKSPDNILIKNVKVSAYKIPTDLPEADGTIEWNSTTIILVEINAADKTGIGYTYAHEATAIVIEKTLKEIVVGKNAMNIDGITSAMIRIIRNNGNCGIAMMAVSAVDNALWDLKAKILDLPLCVLLGQVKNEMLIYGSGGFTSYTDKQLQNQLGGWANEGIQNVKMKIGTHPEDDVSRVKIAREAIGKNTGLFVDANGAYSVKQALEKAAAFTEYNVSWFEEPVTSDNLDGLRFIKEHAPQKINIAAGEYGYNLPYFDRMLHAGAVDILQADATRCGGISYFMKAGYLAEAFQIPFSSHCAPALHLHAALALPSFYIAEYFYDHVRIESMLFDGINAPVNGFIFSDLQRHGMGFEFKYADAEKYKI